MSDEQSIRDELVNRINDELDKWGEGSPSPYALADAISPVIRRIQAEAWTEGHAAGRDYQGDGWNSDAHDPEADNPYRGGDSMTDEKLIEEAAKAIALQNVARIIANAASDWNHNDCGDDDHHLDHSNWGAYIDDARAAFAVFEKAHAAQAEPSQPLDPQPWVFMSDQVFGVRSAVDKGFHSMSGAYYAFRPRAGCEQDRARYEPVAR